MIGFIHRFRVCQEFTLTGNHTEKSIVLTNTPTEPFYETAIGVVSCLPRTVERNSRTRQLVDLFVRLQHDSGPEATCRSHQRLRPPPLYNLIYSSHHNTTFTTQSSIFINTYLSVYHANPSTNNY